MPNLSLDTAHYEVSLSVKLFFFRKNLKGFSYPRVNNNNFIYLSWTFTNLHQKLKQDFAKNN